MDYYYSAVVDGGCFNNGSPNSLGYGSYKLYKLGKLIVHAQFYLANARTNNQAEWGSLLKLLTYISSIEEYKTQDWLIKCDSELVRNQFLGYWKCKDAELNKMLVESLTLCGSIKSVELLHLDNKEVKKVLGH